MTAGKSEPSGAAVPGEAFETFEDRPDARVARGLVYGSARQGGMMRDLRLDLYLPDPQSAETRAETQAQVPLLIWLHAGGFTGGRHDLPIYLRLARQMVSGGCALAMVEYRLGAQEEDLEEDLARRFAAMTAKRDPNISADLAGPAAVAACADLCMAMGWLVTRAGALGLAPRPVLGGSEAGACTALAAAFAAPLLGLERPDPAGVLSYSGALAWPALFEPDRSPVLAFHNPADPQVDIGPVRKLAETCANVTLIEVPDHPNGSVRLWPEEGRAASFGRIRDRLHEWTSARPAAP